ncbi:prealbumin-like fold domain-containing protein [Cellulosimicrobium sp. Marseille-Q8652]
MLPRSSPAVPASRPRRLATVGAALLALALVLALAVPAALSASAQTATGTLSLFKRIENLDTGASEGRRELWTMHAQNVETGELVEGDGLNGVQSLQVPAGTYRIWESGGVAGYRFQDWNCGGEDIFDPTPEVVVSAGGTLTCTVDNEAIYPTLTLVKEVVGGTASPEDWTLRAQGPSSIGGPSGSDEVTNREVRVGEYTLSEEGGPEGYRNDGWACEGAEVEGSTVTIDLADSVTCTVTNVGPVTPTVPTLTLVKEVVGGPATAADWDLTATGPSTVTGTTGQPGVSAVEVEPGAYTLTEDGPAGYDGAWSCTGAAAGDGSGGSVTVAEGEDVVCTATNTWAGATLTLTKLLEGELFAQPEHWTLTATGGPDPDAPVTVSGPSGSDAVTDAFVPAGDYTLVEDGWSGFEAGPWVCTGAPVTGDVVSIGAGADVVCTVTNTPLPSLLTLVKVVDGGPAAPEDWTLSATGPQPDGTAGTISGPSGSVAVTQVDVGEGVHALAESGGPPGYESEGWVCEGGLLQAGANVVVGADEDVVCTVTNTYVESTLTLVKVVVGGSADPAAWTLSATDASGETVLAGPAGSAEVTSVAVPTGTYDLAESGGFGGYVSEGWSCGPAPLDGSTVTLGPGDDVTCVVTNRAELPHLTLVKELDDRGFTGDVEPTDWTLTAVGGGTSISGATGSPEVSHVAVAPGRYVLGETGGPDGWTALRWVCDGARVVQSPGDGGALFSTVVVEPGDDVTCTVTNHWLAGTLTLHKQVVDDVVPVSDWELTASGPTPISGFDGSRDVALVPVAQGTYDLSESGSGWDYVEEGWVCDGGELVDADTVQVDDGADVTCTVTNTVLDPPTPNPTPTPTDPTAPPTDGPTDGPTDVPTGGPDGTPGGDADGGGEMAATGSDVGVMLAVALAALLSGAVLLGVRRRVG